MSFVASSRWAEEPSFATSWRISRAPSLSPISRYALASSSLVPTASPPSPPGESRLRSARPMELEGAAARGSSAVGLDDGKSSPERSKSNEGFSSFGASAGISMAGAECVGFRSKSRPEEGDDAAGDPDAAGLCPSRSRSNEDADEDVAALELESRSKSRSGLAGG